jgi:hypothetical protein
MHLRIVLAAALAAIVLSPTAARAGDEHWSPQFKKPQTSTKMLPNTGMSDGTNKPIFRTTKWHDGKLWICGAWENGVDPRDTSKKRLNVYWYMWTWSPTSGWEPFAWFHSAAGGNGPDGKITDFLWLPDGRMVVSGEFTRLDNPGGIMYHRVDALAVYDPNEPSANKWKPLGGFQYDGTAGPGGSIQSIAYDEKNNDLYMGGSFGGITDARAHRKYPHSPGVHRYDFDTQSTEPMAPGLQRGACRKLKLDTSTTPTTVYIAGDFQYTGGNGEDPVQANSTARYSTGFASWQLGKGWTWYPQKGTTKQDGGKESILQRAADFKYFDGAIILDFLVDNGEIYIVGAFSEGKGSGQTLRGVAKWDKEKQIWIDPTGKGGIGREAYSIAKADNGKIYIAGSFGGPTNKKNYDGFKNGDSAAMCASFDPKTGAWEQLGSGLSGRSMPECRLTVNGDDVYFVGDFNWIGSARNGKGKDDKAWESWYVARWNDTIDFTKTPAQVAKAATGSSRHFKAPSTTWSEGNEHWSRAYPKPPRARGKQSMMSAKTGMDPGKGKPQINGIAKVGETLYFCGRWEAELNVNWLVWTHNPTDGWKKIAWESGGKGEGPMSPPSGLKLHGGKLWVYGSIANYAGIGSYDLETKTWAPLTGKNEQGADVFGNSDPNKGKPVNDVAWNSKTGDMYLVGSTGGLVNPKFSSPKWISQVIRVSKDGVYHPMGQMLKGQTPKAPNIQDCIYIDETQEPADLYVAGVFNFYGDSPTHNSRMAYNVVKWDHKAQDWRPLEVGKGDQIYLSPLNKKEYPNGLPGLPAQPTEVYHGFIQEGFPRIRAITMDAAGNLYAGGNLGIVTGTLPMAKRMKEEAFGLAKYDAKTKTWGPCTTSGGVSRDIFEMSWLDEGRTQLLLTGAFHFDNAWQPLNGAAILDTATGKLSPFGGGLLVETRSQVISSDVVHFVEGDDIYFGGFFDHVGINANDMIDGPIQSSFVAHWNATKNFDPNRGLVVEAVPALKAPGGFSSKSVKIDLKAKLTDGEGTIVWYEKSTNGQFREKGKGGTFKLNLRIKASDVGAGKAVYVAVRRPDGTEGGKIPVRIEVE